MDWCAIEEKVHDLHVEIWRHRKTLCPAGVGPIDLLSPDVAAKCLGIRYEVYEELGTLGHRNRRSEIAGLIDRQAQVIAVSRRFRPEVIRFTGAHEVGHWILHPGEILHRDRPIDGQATSGIVRAPIEREADYYGACFLMPPNLVVTQIEETFGIRTPIAFNEAIAFNLCPAEAEDLLQATEDSRLRELAIASATSFNGRHFRSLANQFQVSIRAMAIRLHELRLIKYP